ncbi:MAG: porphobilinogen synthase [Parachlamydiaceae bacterium]|nr:porphobilinogen synthase [Parachlamydiaceae bacterium]
MLRLRRLRQHPVLRDLIRETELNIKDLVHPLFIKGKNGVKNPIHSMPGHYQIPLNGLKQEITELLDLGLSSVILFGVPSNKDSLGSESLHDQGIIQEAIGEIRKISNDLLIISDCCLCEYTDHGHCGVLKKHNGQLDVDNDQTLEILVKQAVSHAKAGTNVIAPSGMMDGMVKALRKGLDDEGFQHIPILSYSVKYQSSLYGPFRFAAEGAPQHGDRSTHQMDPANALEALREVQLDVEEGADMLMVKPAHSYLDVIYRVKQAYPEVPLGAYHTSGEFSMIKAAAEKGWVDEKKAVLEIVTGIRRAGADFIITYFAKDIAKWKS